MGKGGFVIYSTKSPNLDAGCGYHMEFSDGSTYKVTQMFLSLYFMIPVCPTATTLEKTSTAGEGKCGRRVTYPDSAPSVGCGLWLLAIVRVSALMVASTKALMFFGVIGYHHGSLVAMVIPTIIAILLYCWSPKAS